MKRYRLFGVTLASNFPFVNRLVPADGEPDVTFTCARKAPVKWQAASGGEQVAIDEGRASLHRFEGFEVLRFPRLADFYLWPDRIACHLRDPRHDYLVEIRLLGPVLSYWMERRGICALHASAVAVGGGTVAFLSGNAGGKTAMAAALLKAGGLLLSDDILMVERRRGGIRAHPAYPQMRMWPDEARHFLGHCRGLERIHPRYATRRIPVGANGLGGFCAMARKLDGICILERRGARERGHEVRITPVSPQAALMALLRHSFSPRLVEAAGLQPRRLRLLARIVDEVPVRKVVFPSGFERLRHVCDAVLTYICTAC